MNDQALDIADALEQSHQFDISKIVEMLRYQHSEIERLNQCLTWEQNRAEHIGTHGPGCAMWGPRHYECLLREHEALKERTSQESQQVEPVAYVTGYSKGYATVQPVDPCLLMCVGMALYRSPPKREPVEKLHGVGNEE